MTLLVFEGTILLFILELHRAVVIVERDIDIEELHVIFNLC
jgi:hypothetical protein